MNSKRRAPFYFCFLTHFEWDTSPRTSLPFIIKNCSEFAKKKTLIEIKWTELIIIPTVWTSAGLVYLLTQQGLGHPCHLSQKCDPCMCYDPVSGFEWFTKCSCLFFWGVGDFRGWWWACGGPTEARSSDSAPGGGAGSWGGGSMFGWN